MRAVNGLVRGVATVAPFAAALLVPAGLAAGAWTWPRGWIFVAVFGGLVIAGSTALAVFRPASFEVRRQGLVARRDQKQPWLDAVGSVIYMLFLLGWVAFIPLDVFVLRLLPSPPPLLSALGLGLSVAGVAITQLAVAQNRFAAPTVQDQTAAGQHVVDQGLYGVIRHPLYAGNLLLFGGMILWLGSTAALAGLAIMLAFTFARIALEEGELCARLPGYDAYARRVRARLIPFLV